MRFDQSAILAWPVYIRLLIIDGQSGKFTQCQQSDHRDVDYGGEVDRPAADGS